MLSQPLRLVGQVFRFDHIITQRQYGVFPMTVFRFLKFLWSLRPNPTAYVAGVRGELLYVRNERGTGVLAVDRCGGVGVLDCLVAPYLTALRSPNAPGLSSAAEAVHLESVDQQ
jgi:hypothetical protein